MSDTSDQGKTRQPDTGSIWLGLVLIILGAIFFAQRFGNFELHNWWALFILIPAFTSFGSAIRMWQKDRQLHFGVWSTFYGGLLPLLVALMFMFDLDWGLYWPIFVIVPGIGTMISGLPFPRPKDIRVPTALLKHRPWPFFIGLAATLLGLTFLGNKLGLYDLAAFVPFENWWGVIILIAALGGLITGLNLLVGRHSIWLVLINFAAATAVAMAGIIAILELDWALMDMVGPAILILAGLALLVGFGKRKGPEGTIKE